MIMASWADAGGYSRKVLSRRETNECSATLSHTMQGTKRASIARRVLIPARSEGLRQKERICCHHARGVQLHATDVACFARRIAAVDQAGVWGESAPVVTVGNERRDQQREVVRDDTPSAICRNDTRDRRGERRVVFPGPAENDDLALFDWCERGEDAGAVTLVAEAEAVVDEPKIVEIISPVLFVVLEGATPKHLDTGIVHASSDSHLHVAVDDRPAGTPETVPDEEVVLRARILLIRGKRPPPRSEQAVMDRLGVHRHQRVMLVEHQNAVVAVVLGDVRSGEPMFPTDATERVGRRSGLRMAEGIVPGPLDRLAELVGALHFDRTASAEIVEECALQHHQVGDPNDLLRCHGVDGPELLGDPLAHLGRRIEPSHGRGHREDSLGRGAHIGRKRRDAVLELGDGRLHLGLQAARRAFAAAAYISTYRFAAAGHEWSSRIARVRSCRHGSPPALYRCSARAIASEKATASYLVNEKPLPRGSASTSRTVVARPPTARTTGMVPYRSEMSWPRPHGSNREGIRNRSAPA